MEKPDISGTPICPACSRVITPSNESVTLVERGPLFHSECAEFVKQTQNEIERGLAAYQPWAPSVRLQRAARNEQTAKEWLRAHTRRFYQVHGEKPRTEIHFTDRRGYPAILSGATAEEARLAAEGMIAAQLDAIEYDARDYVCAAVGR